MVLGWGGLQAGGQTIDSNYSSWQMYLQVNQLQDYEFSTNTTDIWGEENTKNSRYLLYGDFTSCTVSTWWVMLDKHFTILDGYSKRDF